jgi:hypothetical protein
LEAAISLDGSTIVTLDDSGMLRAWPVRVEAGSLVTGGATAVLPVSAPAANSLSVDLRGRHVAYLTGEGGDRSVCVAIVRSSSTTCRTVDASVERVSIDPSGRSLALSSNGQVTVEDVTTE